MNRPVADDRRQFRGISVCFILRAREKHFLVEIEMDQSRDESITKYACMWEREWEIIDWGQRKRIGNKQKDGKDSRAIEGSEFR